MTVLSEKTRCQLILSVAYGDGELRCRDQYFCDGVNLWRDSFTAGQLQCLAGLQTGDSCRLASGQVLSVNPARRLRVRKSQWQPPGTAAGRAEAPQPRFWRWYPQGFLHGVANIYPETILPMRVTAVDEQDLTVDCNHPLAGREVEAMVQVRAIEPLGKERGGRCSDWLEEAMANGPGMQLKPMAEEGGLGKSERWPDYYEPNPGEDGRADRAADESFYEQPRLVDHIDGTARAHLRTCTGALLQSLAPKARVLDLMSSIQSHLPMAAGKPLGSPFVVGLGMNSRELAANPALSERLVRDLNRRQELPFPDNSFALVMCHLSMEYLLHPEQIFLEAARVLEPGGKLVISFSDRWFPEKVTPLWPRLHEYERIGYVHYLLRSAFTNFSAATFHNWPRPPDDPHFFEVDRSDPLFVISCETR